MAETSEIIMTSSEPSPYASTMNVPPRVFLVSLKTEREGLQRRYDGAVDEAVKATLAARLKTVDAEIGRVDKLAKAEKG